MTHQPDEARRSGFYVLLAALAFTPYYIVAHYLLGQPRLFGKALSLVALTAIFIGLFLRHARYIIGRLGGLSLLWVWFAAIVVIGLQALLGRTSADIYALRFPFLVFVQGFVALPFVRAPGQVRLLRRVLLWSCIVQAVLGIIHSAYFGNIVTGMALDDSGQAIYVLDAGMGRYRENGTLVSANTYGAFLVLGLALLFAGTRQLRGRSLLQLVAPAGVLWWAIALSGSRYAFACGAIVTLYFLIRATSNPALTILLPAAIAVFVSLPVVTGMRDRFAESGSGGRGAIAGTSIDLATRTPSGLLIGIPAATLQDARTTDDQIISDNSYAEMMLTYGVPLTLVVFGYLAVAWSKVIRLTGWALVTGLLIAGQFAVTNALYWDDYVVFAGATLLALNGVAAGRGQRHAPVAQGRGRRIRSELVRPGTGAS